MKKGFLKIFLAMICLQSWMGLLASDSPICICSAVPDFPDDDPSYTRIEFLKDGSNYGGGNIEGDDGSSVRAIHLPFIFELFSNRIDSIYVNINGSVTDVRVGTYVTNDFEHYSIGSSKFMIAPYWADIHIGSADPITGKHQCGDIYYKYLYNSSGKIAGIKILWHEVGFFLGGGSNSLYCDDSRKTTFELVLTDGKGDILPPEKNVAFCYKKIGFAIGSAGDALPCEGSSYANDDNVPGFRHQGPPATIGAVYKLENDSSLYYMVGQVDRPGASKGDMVEIDSKIHYACRNGETTYSGIDWLLEQSGNCGLAFDWRKEYNVNYLNTCNSDGTFTVTAYCRGAFSDFEFHDYEFVAYCGGEIVHRERLNNSNLPQSYIRREIRLPANGQYYYVAIYKDGDEVGNDFIGNELLVGKELLAPKCDCESFTLEINGIKAGSSISACEGYSVGLEYKSVIGLTAPLYIWKYGDSIISRGGELASEVQNFTPTKSDRLTVSVESEECENSASIDFNLVECSPDSCTDCPSLFAPQAGEKYIVCGWVHVENQRANIDSFENVYIQLTFDLMGGNGSDTINCYPEGNIIDGWQRISKCITIPSYAENMGISLKNDNNEAAYFDDIRFHPFNASMKSYVYDPKTLRLVAELDDENYATFYEYDEEGVLVRVKRETERGIMTLREARQSNPKK